MRLSNQIIKSFTNSFKAFTFIARLKMRWIYLLPFLTYAIVYFSGFALTNELHDQLMHFAKSNIGSWSSDNAFFSFLFTTSSVVSWIIIKIGLFLLFGIISGYLTLIFLSPIFAWLSEKTEQKIKGKEYPFNIQKFAKDVLRAILIAIRNGIIQLIYTILLFALSFVPIVNLITAPALFIITAYFYGFSFIDYSNERLGLTVGESINRVRHLKHASISLGSLFLLSYMIPFIGPLIASIFSFNLVVAGTQVSLEYENESH